MDTQILYLLKQTTQHFNDHNRQAYLVGGSLRNILLGEPCNDWDIVTDDDAPFLARTLADKLGGYYVHLHDKASRVVVKREGQETIIDISPCKGNTIEEDLRQRDFTINAIAAPLAEFVHLLDTTNVVVPLAGILPGGQVTRGVAGARPTFIDPLNGLADIRARRLKAVDEGVFRRDPLRMLRAVRLGMRYKFSIDPETENLIKRDAALLPLAAPERIHDELYAMLEPEGATERLRYLDALGLLTVLIPEFIAARSMRQPRPHYWGVLEHSLETVGALEQLAGMLQPGTHPTTEHQTGDVVVPLVGILPGGQVTRGGAGARYDAGSDVAEIQTLLYEAEEQGIFRLDSLTAPRMKLAALLHDIGKPVTYSTDEEGNIHFYDHPHAGALVAQQIMIRLSASTQDRRLVQVITAHHMRPGQLARVDPLTPRAIRRYFVDLGRTGIYVALLSLADHLATLGPQPLTSSWERHLAVVRLLLTRYIREGESILPPRLVSPEELMRRLKLQPGPLIGQLLEYIAEAQAEGQIHSKEEALWLAEEIAKSK